MADTNRTATMIRQRTACAMMRQRAEILVSTATQDQFGSTSYTSTVGQRWPCRVVHATTPGRDQVVADSNQARSDWHILLPLGAKVAPEDHIRVGGSSGQIYIVIDTTKGQADAAYLLAYCRTEK